MNHMELCFIRHGQTDFNLRRIIQGSGVNSSLNETGRAQARAFYDAYKSVSFDKVIASGLRRTHETVQPWTDAGLPLEIEPLINEMNWGVYEGKPGDEAMHKVYKAMIADWGGGNFDARLEGGESARELSERLSAFLESLKNRTENRLLICSHGRSLRCLVTLMKGQHLREMENVSHANTGLFRATLTDGEFDVTLENDTSHLTAELIG